MLSEMSHATTECVSAPELMNVTSTIDFQMPSFFQEQLDSGPRLPPTSEQLAELRRLGRMSPEYDGDARALCGTKQRLATTPREGPSTPSPSVVICTIAVC